MASEHTAYTTGENLYDAINTMKIRTEAKDGYTSPFTFASEKRTLPGGACSSVLTVFSNSYKHTFKYNAEDGLYYNYMNSKEMKDAACRPAIAGMPADLAAYDTVFIGFPVWWYVEPRIIDAFLASANCTGKKLIPFATSGGSGIAGAERHMKSVCPAADWQKGKLVNGGAAAWAKSLIK